MIALTPFSQRRLNVLNLKKACSLLWGQIVLSHYCEGTVNYTVVVKKKTDPNVQQIRILCEILNLLITMCWMM